MVFDFSWPGERFVKELKDLRFSFHACVGMLKCAHLPGNPEHNIFLLWVLQWPWISTPPASSTLAWLVSDDSTGSDSKARIWEPSPRPESAKMRSNSSLCKDICLFLFQMWFNEKEKKLAIIFQPIASSCNDETMQNRHSDHVTARTLWSCIFIWNSQNVRKEPPKFLN